MCSSNDYCHHAVADGPSSYTTSLSTDTLWDPKSEPVSCKRQSTYKQPRPNTVYHQPTSTTHSYTNRYIHSNQVQPVQSAIATTHAYYQPQYSVKPKSWDNLSGKGCQSSYAFGYLVNNSGKPQASATAQSQQNRAPPLPRKAGHAPYGRYSAFADVENYVPAPQAYVQEATITKVCKKGPFTFADKVDVICERPGNKITSQCFNLRLLFLDYNHHNQINRESH